MKELFQVQQPPATDTAIESLRRWVGKDLPSRYLALLREANGVELGAHDEDGDCLCLWSATEIPELNAAYSIQRWLPDTFAIGSDGGDDAVLLDMSAGVDPEGWPVIRVGFGALAREEFFLQAPSFAEWATLEFRLVRTR